ncbi:glycosyltransferase family 2 protein [Nocardioides sp. KR10-350]|uniref:glycosyltransferase family 2 protein n=1 Tax=Nocardioides cheoyonin TaxID=3156615 RepID=UPI0032B36B6D
MHSTVALVLVSHDGARWLPTVIDGIRAQQAPIAAAVGIDTGSKDESPELLEAAFGVVTRTSGRVSFPEAVDLALDQLGDGPDAPEWVWLLHDDSTPDPGALAALLACAEEHPEADVLGPKLREWPSLRRLLEMGVTISGTGRRETGLERAEYDQGQHDEVRTVLAVNTAGMLVRRRVLRELGGFDKSLPMFGNDIDFGWRAAYAGHTTIVVPQAVVFHAEAAHRGVRRTPLTGRHTHYQERRSALYTLLANSRARSLPFMLLRLALGTLWRMLGFLVVREVGAALDELAALVNVYGRLGGILAARRSRQRRAAVDPAKVKALLPPPWLPYRHGLDFVSDVASALTNQAADVAERRRAAKAEADPASFAARRQAERESQDEDDIPVENGWVVRFFTNPVAVLLTLVGLLGIIGARSAFGTVAGGGLSPVPAGATDWWGLHLESWHALGGGTAVPAPPYVLPLAVLATILGGHTGLAVTVVMILSFPLALGGAWRLLRVVGRLISHRGAPRWLLLWGATAYALVPAVSGAWGDGRLGPVVAGALLPWMVHAALGFADPEPDRRWRAAWRAGLLLSLVTAFAPTGWLAALVLGGVVLAIAFRLVPGSVKDRDVWGPPATALAVPPVLLLPWWLPAVLHGAWRAVLLDPGRLPAPVASGGHLLVGRLDGLGAPWWLGLALPLLALVALVPVRTRIPVLVCWIAGAVIAVVAAVLSWLPLHLPAGTAAAGQSFALVAIQGAAVVAAVLGAQGALLDGIRGWRRIAAGVVATVGIVAAVGGLGWFVVSGHGSLTDDADQLAHEGVPSYMLDTATHDPVEGVLVLRGSVDEGLRYTVLRGDGVTLGTDEITAATPEDQDLTALVRRLASSPDSDVIEQVARQGIEYVVMPSPSDHSVAEGIDASGGLTQASTTDRSTRAWQLDAAPTDPALDGHRSWLRIGLLVIQLVGVVVVVVLCVPTLERRRRR